MTVYLWFSLKDQSVLNRHGDLDGESGRHGPTPGGPHNCLGFGRCDGLFRGWLGASMEDNKLTADGVPTAIEIQADRQQSINYLQGTAKIRRL